MVAKRSLAVAEFGCMALVMLTMLNSGRHLLCFLIASLSISHLVIADYILNLEDWYYLSAVIPSAIAVLIILTGSKTSLVLDLSWIMFAQILINILGWLVYEANGEPMLYNILSSIFYICMVVRLIIRTDRDGRDYPNSSNSSGLSELGFVSIQGNKEGKR